MRRAWNIALWIIGVWLALVVVVLIVVATFDWNRLKPTINAQVSETIGRPFAINGDLGVHWQRERGASGMESWVPWPEFVAQDIRVGNPDWASQPIFAHLEAVHFRVAPLPLLAHQVEIPVLYLTQPTIDLERDGQGRANWDIALSSGGSPSAWQLDLHAIGFDRGHVSLADAMSKTNLQVTMETLQRAIPYDEIVAQQSTDAREQAMKTVGASGKTALTRESGKEGSEPGRTGATYQFVWQAVGKYQGLTVDGDGKTGGVLALQQIDQPFPLQADVHVGDSHIALVGTLTDPLHLAALDIRLWFSGTSMAKLYRLIGVTLPDTPPYATEGHLRANLKRGASHFSYDHFRGRVGGSDLSGSLAFDAGGVRPKLTGALNSRLLRFSDLAPLIGADTNAQKQQRGDATPQPADKVLPVEPFRTDRWRAMDADVTFSASKIEREAQLPINGLSAHVIMDNGVLTLDPLDFDLAGGTVASNLHIDGSTTPMKGTIRLKARHLKLKELFPTFEPMRTSFGEINGDAALDARGNSVSELMGTSTGELKLLMNDGAISKTLLETAGLNVANVVIGKLFGDKTVKINCAASDMAATNGLYETRLFMFDTEDATIRVNGTINFADEKLDLDVRPASKGLRILSLRSPLYVKGSLKNPDVGVQAGPVILRGGGALALGVFAAPVAALLPLVAASQGAPDNACATVLEQMSGPSKARPAPLPTRAKAPQAH
jgi:uncharacterized protein involved in outer membrane biogenesis